MIRFKLSLMLFLQYLMFAVWWVPLAAYLTNLDVGSTQKALILSSMAIGCLASPLVGMLADRFWPAQYVLAGLNLITAVMLLLAGMVNDPNVLFICLLVAMLAHMPTWSLSSAIAMAHLPSEQFPKVRVFGSVGWVASGIFSVIFINLFGIDIDGTNIPFYCGGGVSLLAILANLTLPNTPPLSKGEKATLIDVFGLRTARLMKERNFAIFTIFAFLVTIPFAMYFAYFSEFLLNIEVQYITVTINWGILAEMGFLLLVPLAIKRFGLRKTMILGLVALTIRYLSFYIGGVIPQPWMIYIGILVHGLIFGFFYVGAQIYTDRKAPAKLKSQAQGFIFLVTMGLGMLVGNFLSARLIDHYKYADAYNWDAIWGVTTIFSAAMLIGFVLLFREEKKAEPSLTEVHQIPGEL